MREKIKEAIKNKRLLEFHYEGRKRVVEPHCYGQSTKGNSVMRAYQVSGYSSSGKMGWKLYDLSKASSVILLGEIFDNPRSGYRRGDSAMSVIYAQI
jgi:hypothetical protein